MSRRRWLIAIAVTVWLAAVAAAVSTGAVSSGKLFGGKAEPAFKTEVEKASYVIGLNLARQLKTIAKDLDERALTQGFNDGRTGEGRSRLTREEIAATIASLRNMHKAKLTEAHASAGTPVTQSPGLSVLFKLDPRLTASYGGDRWVSPATYTRVGDATSAVIEARAQAQSSAAAKAAAPEWTASDPEMVSVSPAKGAVVTITVKRAGTSTIQVASGEMRKELSVTAQSKDNALQVSITQH